MSFRYSHAATLVAIRNGQGSGEIELLAFLYTKHDAGKSSFSSWKFPTETGETGETRWATAMKCAVEELCDTPDNPEGFNFRSLGPRGEDGEPMPFLVCRVPGDPQKDADWHDKCAYILEIAHTSVERLRKVERWDGEDELLDPPEFVEASVLWQRMLEQGQPFHRAVLYQVLYFLAQKRPLVRQRYDSILSDRNARRSMMSHGRPIEFI